MAINLQKGQRENINAPRFTIGLGWDTNSSSTGSGFDLDASVFILGENKKLVSDSHFRKSERCPLHLHSQRINMLSINVCIA